MFTEITHQDGIYIFIFHTSAKEIKVNFTVKKFYPGYVVKYKKKF